MSTSIDRPAYPVHVDARLDPQLSRGLWLVKWLLVIPHYVVLTFLWMAFVVLSVVAFFAILFTGRYPRAIFDFNVGVMRWSWRVAYYAYGALATDRYPPFSLSEEPDYPAHLQIEYPEHLSRGLVLIKWWLLAIPHYLIVGIFVSGGIYLSRAMENDPVPWASGAAPWMWGNGLIGLLAVIAAVVLLFTGSYPRQLFDLVLGLNRWVVRVAAYAGLMTDQYPPFRLDQGGDDPGTSVPPPAPPTAPGSHTATRGDTAHGSTSQTPTSRWGTGRVLSVVLASVAMLFAIGLLAGGTAGAIANSTMRDHGGFLMSETGQLSTGTYALSSPTIEVHSADVVRNMPHRMFGDAKVTVTTQNGKAVFVGLARAADADRYLATVRHANVSGSYLHPTYRVSAGGGSATRPGDSDIWVAKASGAGTQSVVVPVSDGRWTVVVMNADGSAGVDTTMSVGATVPGLTALTAVLFSVGGAVLVVSLVVLAVAVRGAGRWREPGQ
ncbi:MAG TPA: DUF4389 domain-containing protein [Segeticoccus sp.]|uniref:DUF4389 domain-containing protein n=1 Tax=Segeticoccus sp. TaxID=2706531 RepID=UPI002D802EA8|nr:DUF4389 domain-containing protein [Segeticoccus sp.]HET8600985.1 DUF4389 domain-containing protein [Segeticoccus sp.]